MVKTPHGGLLLLAMLFLLACANILRVPIEIYLEYANAAKCEFREIAVKAKSHFL